MLRLSSHRGLTPKVSLIKSLIFTEKKFVNEIPIKSFFSIAYLTWKIMLINNFYLMQKNLELFQYIIIFIAFVFGKSSKKV